ncbi:efflux RND transporter periplasmic adaptor subunit [Undibacterium oligocarboniphilum]|uniref:Efflux RND transporter periplasmic adaptor subunit n=2 Tax=Undibacterium oligocarboniphilum TaxID=666702 RepID=A0A850QAP7_9BURK|nr:efflux RND transporter periplasmic adaptor subunit [Undibacterium oligocarboniphilum]MBC3869799.1 efflux RND transporter periplasmic adaptor subunit [Undibacterium oligocarboniphilum]NVO77402.1 efflux RND transporter periplasmic adaptor subunit [Undibacterium oligocarboniphilum]
MLRLSLIIVCMALAMSGCNKKTADQAKTSAAAEKPLMITKEDLSMVSSNALASGPVINGSIQPERKADLRSEISSVVLQVLKENGEAVRRGDLLVRLDDTSIKDSLNSALEAERAALQTYDQAERQMQRLKTLRASGMASTQQLEDAEIRRNNTQSDLVAAKARTVQARQQLQRTEVRAPFDGVVSERKVSAGDTAQIGKELVKVIDPASMRFEGLVSADKVTSVKIGQTVRFRINGYANQEFSGKVKRVDLAANATTRQVEVLVNFAEGSVQPRVSGLFAEGMIEAASAETLMIPGSALIRDGDKAYAWRIKDGVLHKVSVVIGQRDARRGDYAVRSGLNNGDQVISNPLSTLKDGQKVQMVASAGAIAATSTAASAASVSAAPAPAGK